MDQSHERKYGQNSGHAIVPKKVSRYRPLNIGVTYNDWDALYALATGLGFQGPSLGRKGKAGPVGEMIRAIARGEIVMAWKASLSGKRGKKSNPEPEPEPEDEEPV